MSPLERRCRALLRAYPRWYRRSRGEEMLATLLEASRPGQRWPSARDARALIMGGLRVRATHDQRLTTAANVRLAAQLGAVLTLLMLVTRDLASVALVWTHMHAVSAGISHWVVYGLLLPLAAVLAAWFAPRPVVAVLTVAAAVAAAWVYWDGDRVMAILPAGLLVMLAALVFIGERMPRSWLWLPGALFAWSVLQVLATLRPLFFLFSPLLCIPWVILGIVMLWAFVDTRLAMALGIYIACNYFISGLLNYLAYGYGMTPVLLVPAAAAAVLAVGSLWRLRRQAVL
jgi:hypothetical protein